MVCVSIGRAIRLVEGNANVTDNPSPSREGEERSE